MVERPPFERYGDTGMPGEHVKTVAIAQIASAYAAKDSSTIEDILALVDGLSRAFHTVERAASTLAPGAGIVATTASDPEPAVPIEDAIQDEKVICLECGEAFTMLKRHLKAEHGLTEEQYRAKYSLPDDFPLVAPAYSKRKADYARQSGLGKHSRDGLPNSD